MPLAHRHRSPEPAISSRAVGLPLAPNCARGSRGTGQRAPPVARWFAMTTPDPLLQPFQLKQLTLRNRFLSTAHEPAYTEDGMPKTRYRLYHAEKAKGRIALTMIGGSAVVAPDSPPGFRHILLYQDEVVRWVREPARRV